MKESNLRWASHFFVYADIVLIILMVASILCIFVPGLGSTHLNIAVISVAVLLFLCGPFSLVAALLAGLCSASERGDSTLGRILLGGLAACVVCVVFMTVCLCYDPVSLGEEPMSAAEYLGSGDGVLFTLGSLCFVSYVYAGVAALLTAYRSYAFVPGFVKQNCETPSIDETQI